MNRLFADVLHPKLLSNIVDMVCDYANREAKDIYMMTYPKSDLSNYDNTTCFLLMSSGYKIAIVNNKKNADTFQGYVNDICEIFFYLFQKYGYRSELGRFNQWSEDLFVEKQVEELEDLPYFWQSIKLVGTEEIRNSQLLISLCTGSINDIKKVKSHLPTNLLDKVKQRIQLFDADQTRFIYQDINKKVIKIQGLSGTGKTELLLHKLKGLYLDKQDSRIFITCHNKILADSLKNRIPVFFDFMKVTQQIEWNKRLWCTNAWGSASIPNSGLYRFICSYYQIPFHPYSKTFTFDVACKEAITNIKNIKLSKNFTYALDYVLIDECQDFKPSFIELCKLITRYKVYLAGDIFQSIFSDFEQNDYEADYFLSKCYRTDPKTLMIAQALGLGLFEHERLRWLTEDNWRACGYTCNDIGDSIELSRQPIKRFSEEETDFKSIYLKRFNSDSPVDQIIEIIKKIRQDYNNVVPGDISVIMLDNHDDIYEWSNQLERRLYSTFNWFANKAYESKAVENNKLLISNRNNVKGLEYPFVICVTRALGSSYGYRNALYTMLSRSFLVSYLLISGVETNGLSQGIIDGIKEVHNKHMMTIRKPTEAEKKVIETKFTQAQSEILKPFDEKLNDIMNELNIPKSIRAQILKLVSSNNFHWEDLSNDELKIKIQFLSAAL